LPIADWHPEDRKYWLPISTIRFITLPSDAPRKSGRAEYADIGYAIARMFGNAEERAPFAGALQLITTALGYDVGAFWVVNDKRVALDCIEYFSRVPLGFPQFETVTRARHFSLGEGLPGSVWGTREVIHIADVTHGENFPRFSIAKQEGLRTGVAFPLYCGKSVLGVMEFFSQQTLGVSAEMKDFLLALGGQMGVFIERLTADRALDSADAQFRLVAQAASMAIFTIDEQSNVLFANAAVEKIFGYKPEELLGGKLTVVMPEYLRHVHEQAVRRYVLTGQRHVSWEGIPLPGLHKDGTEIALIVAFGEFYRKGKRIFTGFAKLR
jgi:PAS domain S-box-containing protein